MTGTIENDMMMMIISAGTLMIILYGCDRAMASGTAGYLRAIGRRGRLMLWIGFGAGAKMIEHCKHAVQFATWVKREPTNIQPPALWARASLKFIDGGSSTLAGECNKLDSPGKRSLFSNTASFKIAAESHVVSVHSKSTALTERSGALTERSCALDQSSASAHRSHTLTHRSGAIAFSTCAHRSCARTN